jgi:hypothetical protein
MLFECAKALITTMLTLLNKHIKHSNWIGTSIAYEHFFAYALSSLHLKAILNKDFFANKHLYEHYFA